MSRRKQPAPKTTVYKRPYWFDRARSLAELYGWPRRAVDPDDHGLIGRYTNAVNRPVGQLDAEALFMLLTQRTDPHYLVPVALEVLRRGADARLLLCILRLPEAFWRVRPYLRGELLAFVTDPDSSARRLAGADDELIQAVDAFVERARSAK